MSLYMFVSCGGYHEYYYARVAFVGHHFACSMAYTSPLFTLQNSINSYKEKVVTYYYYLKLQPVNLNKII